MAGQARSAAARAERTEDYHRQVADALIAQIEKGTAPWTQAWSPGERLLPANVKTGKAYRGGNSVWLASRAESRGYADHRWGTFKQVKELGGQVRRGEKGSRILFWQFEDRRIVRDRLDGSPVLGEEGRPVYETRPLAAPRVYPYTVFNADQCDGLPRKEAAAGQQEWDRIEEAERILRGSGAAIEHSSENRAYYNLPDDRIVLPFREQFGSAPGYYQAALHELGHWTGHPSRLDRETLTKGIVEGPYSKHYAREELRAEISSMITGNRLELGHDPSRHASYVSHWVKALRDDPREVYRASRDAQAISDYILDRDRQRDPSREAAPAPETERRPAPAPELPPAPPPSPTPSEGEQYRLFQRGRPAPGR